MKISQIREQLFLLEEKNDWSESLQQDTRLGVQKLLAQWEKRNEINRLKEAIFQEKVQFDQSYNTNSQELIAGIDEAGRGPLAGPVVTAAVVFSSYPASLVNVHDSKQLRKEERERLAEIIEREALAYSIHIQSPERIDEINIYEATRESMGIALHSLKHKPSIVLIDAMTIDTSHRQHSIIKGDTKSLAIAAASILAKTTRDRLMDAYDKEFPQYGFAQHAGYGTKRHVEALHEYGPCTIHRKTFEPIKSLIQR
ncbi:ribonuclease HII [Paenisporosarcina cavernae]|uniref:Ribonuclease HII n=1 Tax=Paenisporosarcina cavernae TaxID=2320858 RepID=A0A385YRU9_9BACL|nr:ribonuclease HII [Paenisporosarcina cavernae]AYC29224.1 ribonuclease HII [Paenisporosarcina cavernae]